MINKSKDSHTHTLPGLGLDIPIFTKTYEFYKLLSDKLISFPKTKRYTLGQKLDNTTLEIFEIIFSLVYSKDKNLTLQKMSVKLDLLKILLRLAKDSNCLKNNDYLNLQTLLQEIGRMLGGWIRTAKQNT